MIFDLPFPHAPDFEEPIIPEISSGILEELFNAAGESLKVRPWNKLHDTNWFGIVDPDSGETHIVAIMGAGGQFCAVQVYLPDEGILFWNDFIRTGIPDINLGQYNQRMLSCEFVSWNEEDLDETDMLRNEQHTTGELVVDYLDSFLFRSTRPGQVNWHPTEEESLKLLDALRLVPHFLKQWDKLPAKCYGATPDNDMPWIPSFQLPEKKDRRLATDWKLTTIRFPEAKKPDTYLPDELFPSRLSSHPIKKGKTWQIGSAYFEKAVIVEGRPTWLLLTLTTTEDDGFALGSQLLPCTEAPELSLRKCLLNAAIEVGHLPEKLKVRSPLAKRVFKDIPGITIVQQDKLPLLDQITRQIIQNADIPGEDHPLANLTEEAIEQINSIMASAPPLDQVTPEIMKGLIAQVSEIEGTEPFLQSLFNDQADPPFPHLGTPAPAERKPATRNQSGTSDECFVFRIDLEGLRPPIWRRLSISTDATFADLDSAIQSLFDWDGSHCHVFEKRQGRRISLSIGPDPNYADQSEDETRLKDVFKRKGTKLHYVYDFGDNWTHLIKLEEKVKSQPEEDGPACLAGRGIAPPEDCGGLWGFLNLLNPDSGYAEEMDWGPEEIQHLRDGKFDPKSVRFL
ncbi:plasmid pRiA4b ORF-3 family protein [Haloferula chungangensis]|uniref:Plasmid pRiA4b ORF-3 family protein n=1 Tax=Haloferula chungangensis TaxID=1048331 RepID=A0ABW2L7X8_9BACT